MEKKKIQKGDFIEIDYTGKLKDEGVVFDTTKKEEAIANNLTKKDEDFKPIIICVGEGFILPAIEQRLEGKETGKHCFEITAEEGFGKKSAKLLKLIPMKVFKKEDIMPYPGLEVNIDNSYGIVRTVSGGRVIVDFNHPLSGRELLYDIEVKRIVTDNKEKIDTILKMSGLPYDSVSVKEKKAMIVLNHEINDEIKKMLEEQIRKHVKIDSFNYIVKKTKKEENKEENK